MEEHDDQHDELRIKHDLFVNWAGKLCIKINIVGIEQVYEVVGINKYNGWVLDDIDE